ncbi:protein of unknown function (plasmid) [Magnetospirillum sp. XM-1]|uniref:hypothetical protein n=1 Tax=Magnetospirillum sp. XM-1 TaxID=1663591 RepID=UPI00073DD617|nr:hypothetical protein [Magnetospirillum sp. XM-1]CUW41937.1 protein of unknown function [Magnetospirillum sp. XM-1]
MTAKPQPDPGVRIDALLTAQSGRFREYASEAVAELEGRLAAYRDARHEARSVMHGPLVGCIRDIAASAALYGSPLAFRIATRLRGVAEDSSIPSQADLDAMGMMLADLHQAIDGGCGAERLEGRYMAAA